MQISSRIAIVGGAISIVLAFGGLFIGRLMIYPVARAHGTFFERVAAEATAWDWGHRVMLLGMISVIPASLALRHAFRERSPLLTDIAAGLGIVGAALGVGQYALDYAMLAAARLPTAEAARQFDAALREQAFVQWVFYRLPDLAQVGLLLFTIALWRQGAGWRWQAALVSVAALSSLGGPLVVGSMGVRIALGLWFVGFSSVALKIALANGQQNPKTARNPLSLPDTLPRS